MRLRRAMVAPAMVCMLATGCGSPDVDLDNLNVGTYSTSARNIPNQPSLPDGTVLEGIRMSDAVADTSQFGSALNYLWQSGPIPDTTSLVPVIGETGRRMLDRYGWIAGYRATYSDAPQRTDRGAPPNHVALSIMLLRFPDDVAAKQAASALELTNWTDFGRTVAAPLPKHPEIAARYTPGTGALLLDTPVGPFVLRLKLEAPQQGIGIETRIGELDAVIDEEQVLLQEFTPTPASEITSLPRDPDGFLARMVATDPAEPTPPSTTFAVYGPTGALRDQLPMIRKDRLYEKWGVDRLAVSGTQHLYRLRDSKAAKDMAAEMISRFSDVEQEIAADPNLPNTRCFYADAAAANLRGYTCRMWFDDIFTVVSADSAPSVIEMAAAQYVLLANR